MKFTPSKYIDLKLVLLLAGFYTLFNLVFLGKIAYVNHYIMMERSMQESLYHFIVNIILLDWFIVVGYMTLIAINTKKLLNKNYSWVKIFTVHTIFSILIGIVIRFLVDVAGILRGHFTIEDYSIKESLDRFILVVDVNFLIYFAMIFIIYTYYYLKQVKETEKQKAVLETQLVNTRIKMLSSQLQPHFLFNTLNSISALVEMDVKKAQNTIADLSDFLREILYSKDAYMVSLHKELRILEYYLNIVQVRFSDHLTIEKKIDENLLNHEIPALLLQPILENSIKHGYSYNHTNLKIIINILKEGSFLVIRIENNGKLLSENHENLIKEGVGLANLNDRLSNIYKDRCSFEIKNKTGLNGVETVIKIPYNLSS